MSDPLLRELDHYVVLEPAGAEQILTAAETLAWLEGKLEQLEPMPADLAVLIIEHDMNLLRSIAGRGARPVIAR